MRKLTNKKADINLSFGVIFSIILIAVFVFAAIYAINFFLNYSKCAQVGRFYNDLQGQVDLAFSSSSTENKPFEISLPGNVRKVCFANLSAPITNPGEEYEEISYYYLDDFNVFIIPGESGCNIPYKKINNINLSRIIEHENPFCFSPDDTLLLTKKIYDRTVLIGRR
jgi:hypothetical protein